MSIATLAIADRPAHEDGAPEPVPNLPIESARIRLFRYLSTSGLPWLAAALLVVGVWALYGRVLAFDFLRLDDPFYILEHPTLNLPWPDLLKTVFTEFWRSTWMPVTWISHGLDWKLWGADATGHRAMNIAIHTVNTILIFRILTRLAGRLGEARNTAIMIAFLAATLFAVHPVQAESVVWLSERKNLLYAMFYLIGVDCWLNYTRPIHDRDASGATHGSTGWYIATLAAFALALGSKAMAVTFPAVLLLLDWGVLRRFDILHPVRDARKIGAAVVEKLPFLGLLPFFMYVVLKANHSVRTQSLVDLRAAFSPVDVYLAPFGAIWVYLRDLVAPFWLSPFMPLERGISLFELKYGLGGLAVIGITGLAVVLLLRRRPLVFLVWVFFIGTVSPTLVSVAGLPMLGADRYIYLSCIGGFALVALGVVRAWGPSARGAMTRPALAIAMVGVIAGLAYQTYVVQPLWEDDYLFWSKAMEMADKEDGAIYMTRSEYAGRAGNVEQQRDDCSVAVRLTGNTLGALSCRATANYKLGNYDVAIADFTELAEQLNSPHGYLGRAMVYRAQGKLYLAMADLRKGIGLFPNSPLYRVAMAEIHTLYYRYDRACRELLRAVQLGHDDWPVLESASVFARLRTKPCFARILALKPSS